MPTKRTTTTTTKKVINHKNGMPYYVFKKTERMDKIIDLYRKVIHTI